MIAGGSGITPMFQVAQGILRNPLDATKVFLIYANVTEEDILLRKELDAWARDHRARFKVCFSCHDLKFGGIDDLWHLHVHILSHVTHAADVRPFQPVVVCAAVLRVCTP